MISRRRFEKYIGRALPDPAKEHVGRVYNHVRVRRANLRFTPVSLDRDAANDAPQHVVCVAVDALRADVINAETAPFLSSLTGVDAVTPAPWTFPAVSSLLTGRYPHEHGAIRQSDDPHNTTTGVTLSPSMSANTLTLPEILEGFGYETYGAFAFEMPFLALSGRFSRHALYRNDPAATVLGDHHSWLVDRGSYPTFSYVHLSDLHEPVAPPEEYVERFDVDTSIKGLSGWRYTAESELDVNAAEYVEHRRRLYRAATRYVDDLLSAYYRSLIDGLGTDVTLIVTGDHGEGFWEHAALDAEHFVDSRPAYCVGHGGTPYECISRVPLVVDGLSLDGFESDGLVSLIDVAPTVLDAVGASGVSSTTGRSLFDEVPADRTLLVEAARYGYEKKAVYREGWKRILSEGDDVSLGFSIPAERVTEIPPEIEAVMTDALPAWPDADGTAPEQEVSKTVERRLEQLGYK